MTRLYIKINSLYLLNILMWWKSCGLIVKSEKLYWNSWLSVWCFSKFCSVSSDFTADEKMEIESIKTYKEDLLDEIQVHTQSVCQTLKSTSEQKKKEKAKYWGKNIKGFSFILPCLEVKVGDRQRHGRNTHLWVFRGKVSFNLGKTPTPTKQSFFLQLPLNAPTFSCFIFTVAFWQFSPCCSTEF